MLGKIRITDDLSVTESVNSVRIYSELESKSIDIGDEELKDLIAYFQKRQHAVEREESFPQ